MQSVEWVVFILIFQIIQIFKRTVNFEDSAKRGENMNNDYKRLVRSNTNRSICGICGGIGEYTGIDPTVIRLIWVVASFASIGMGALVYLVAALVIPQE